MGQIAQTEIDSDKLQAAFRLWPAAANSNFELINHTENATFLLNCEDGTRKILRVNRLGYNSERAINSELAWVRALRRDEAIPTPIALPGTNGEFVQSFMVNIDPNASPQFMVMFEFEEGVEPTEFDDLTKPFEQLGILAAKAHRHTKNWQRPEKFERLEWTEHSILDPDGLWGDWRQAPLMDENFLPLYARLDQTLRRRLNRFGKGEDRYGLIHADMRLANLLIDGPTTKLIDFDDCGFCWYLYDFAAAVSFIEDSPKIPALRAAWLKGYRSIADLSGEDEQEIETFIMLRRMALTAWIGSHIQSPFATEMAKSFVPRGAKLAEAYLSKFE